MNKPGRILLGTLFYILLSGLVYGQNISDFSLKNVNGKWLGTADYKNAKGFILVFSCNHCPFAKLYTGRLNDLHRKYARENVPLLMINSMDSLVYEDETFEYMKRTAKKEKYQFPYLQDASQAVGKQFGATHTPMAFVIWKENNGWLIRYKGAIDDNGEKPALAESYLAAAVDELLQNKSVSRPESASFGCRIFYREK